MRVLDLFSGIGGFSLGLERAGMKTVAFCEIDPFCQQVLRKHWPDVPIYNDVRTFDYESIETDIIAAGFPCQDISYAGKGAGLRGERSGLWWQVRRAIRLVRPRFAVLENVAALLTRGMGTVLGSLSSIGYDTEWHCIPACAVGAPHERKRIWIIAYPASEPSSPKDIREFRQEKQRQSGGVGIKTSVLSNSTSERLQGQGKFRKPLCQKKGREGQADYVESISVNGEWGAEPSVGRVANGIPNQVDRLKSLGNAVVPQIPEIIGKAIMEVKNAT